MGGLELNKIAAAVLVAGIIAMVSGFIAEGLYEPEKPEKRGFEVAVSETPAAGGAPVEEKPVDIKALMAAADPKSGEGSAKKCVTCHSFGKGEPNKVGPNLYDIVGNKHAHVAGFAYSPAMTSQAGAWDYQALYNFIHNPKKAIPGTKMAFAGVSKPEEVANIIAYLRSLSGSPKPLP